MFTEAPKKRDPRRPITSSINFHIFLVQNSLIIFEPFYVKDSISFLNKLNDTHDIPVF